MNSLVSKDFRSKEEGGLFYSVFSLLEEKFSWEEASQLAPTLPKGWYELSHISAEDRIAFTQIYWEKTLLFAPQMHAFLEPFFSHLDDIAIYLTKDRDDVPHMPRMVYSLRNIENYFIGLTPAMEMEKKDLLALFDIAMPEGYYNFLKLHNGFALGKEKGFLPIHEVPLRAKELYRAVHDGNLRITSPVGDLDVTDLIPFCVYDQKLQCFYQKWHPEQKIGNVALLLDDRRISNYADLDLWLEEKAFPTFSDFFMFYLERGLGCIR